MSGRTFKQALRDALPRGIGGREPKPVSAEWGDVWSLGSKFPYGVNTPNGRRGIFLGYDGEGEDGRPVGFTDDRHVMTIAGSRGGKGRSLVVPNLLMYEGSVLAIDPKGELARVTSRARAEMGQRVVVLDPFGASPKDCRSEEQRSALAARLGHYNPLAELDPTSDTFIEDAAVIANALIKDSRSNDRFWADSAKILVHALIMFVFTLSESERNLCTVRDLLALKGKLIARAAEGLNLPPERALWQLLKQAGDQNRQDDAEGDEGQDGEHAEEAGKDEQGSEGKQSAEGAESQEGGHSALGEEDDGGQTPAPVATPQKIVERFEDMVRSAGYAFGDMHDNGRSSVLATARTETAFLDSPLLRETLRKSDFKMRDLKQGKVTVYLCLPAGRMTTHANWLRTIIDLGLYAFEGDTKQVEVPLLMVLDEFPVLGYMRTIEAAAGQIAGFGVKLWTIVQDITQLQRLYRDTWQTFVANSGVVTAFANTDGATLEYLSRQLGKITMDMVKESGASAAQMRAGASLTQKQVREDPLLAPHEIATVFEREQLRILVMAAGLPPLALQRARYDKNPNFEGRYDL